MGKLMLASTFGLVSRKLERIEPDLKGRTVVFIPTASMKDSTGFFNRMAKWKLRALGLNVQEIDVAVASYHDIKTTIASSSMIYVTGGNTFYLLQSLRYSSADELIAQAVREGKTYIGESAGAVVAGPTLNTSNAWTAKTPPPTSTATTRAWDSWTSASCPTSTAQPSANPRPKSCTTATATTTWCPSATIRPYSSTAHTSNSSNAESETRGNAGQAGL